MFYNDFTLNYFKDLKYSGSLINPTHKAMIGSVKQEAIVKLQFVVKNDVVKEIKYKVFGNVALIVSMEYLANKLIGKKIEDISQINYNQIVDFFQLTPIQVNSAIMAVDAFKSCIKS